jgi:hypothetical protein
MDAGLAEYIVSAPQALDFPKGEVNAGGLGADSAGELPAIPRLFLCVIRDYGLWIADGIGQNRLNDSDASQR